MEEGCGSEHKRCHTPEAEYALGCYWHKFSPLPPLHQLILVSSHTWSHLANHLWSVKLHLFNLTQSLLSCSSVEHFDVLWLTSTPSPPHPWMIDLELLILIITMGGRKDLIHKTIRTHCVTLPSWVLFTINTLNKSGNVILTFILTSTFLIKGVINPQGVFNEHHVAASRAVCLKWRVEELFLGGVVSSRQVHNKVSWGEE